MNSKLVFILYFYSLFSIHNAKVENLIPLEITFTCEKNPIMEGHIIGSDKGYFTLQSNYY